MKRGNFASTDELENARYELVNQNVKKTASG